MSCIPANPGVNFRSASRDSTLDCFVMNKVTQAFSATFEGVSTPAYIEWVAAPEAPAPVPPYTFVAARSAQSQATVLSLIQAAPMPGQTVNLYNAQVIMPIDVTITDGAGTTFSLTGVTAFVIQITTSLTYDEVLKAGMPLAMFSFHATSGVFTDICYLTVTLEGAADLVFVSPMLLKVRHEGNASFMKPSDEHMYVLTPTFDLRNFGHPSESPLCRVEVST